MSGTPEVRRHRPAGSVVPANCSAPVRARAISSTGRDPPAPLARTPIESLHGSFLAMVHRMTPHEPDAAAALAALGLGFELEADDERALDRDDVFALRDAASLLAYATPPVLPPSTEWRRLMKAVAAPLPRTRAGPRRRTVALALAL
ncbi:MAG TPA: hypothetical protein VHE35_33270, partial [Kofleriaceae bacterium]|nr:hypothetical protein [Kofleriaceae bacterium]